LPVFGWSAGWHLVDSRAAATPAGRQVIDRPAHKPADASVDRYHIGVLTLQIRIRHARRAGQDGHVRPGDPLPTRYEEDPLHLQHGYLEPLPFASAQGNGSSSLFSRASSPDPMISSGRDLLLQRSRAAVREESRQYVATLP